MTSVVSIDELILYLTIFVIAVTLYFLIRSVSGSSKKEETKDVSEKEATDEVSEKDETDEVLEKEEADKVSEEIVESLDVPESIRKMIRTYIEDGVIMHHHDRKISDYRAYERELKFLAEELTKEEAWRGAKESFWKIRRDSLKRWRPHIFNEMRYWETHLDEYAIYMGMKLIFGMEYEEYDFWVDRRGIYGA